MEENSQTLDKMRDLYPDIEPYDTGRLKVSQIHEVYYEQCGNREGNPIMFIHGGPGGGLVPENRTYFDPSIYRIVLMDQRGAGKSTPPAELRENTTWDLVADIETLRTHLGIESWVIFGQSWGSTLALAYAETHPSRVKAMVVQGIFTNRRREIKFVNQDGLNMVYPDYWEAYIAEIPEAERGDCLSAYHRLLTSEDAQTQLKAARAWNRWESMIASFIPDPNMERDADDMLTLQHARLECHYFIHGAFLKTDTQLLDDASKLCNIPGTIVQGRYDMACAMETAWLLHKNWPSADFHIVPEAGHSSRPPEMISRLVEATDKYKHL